MDNGVDSKATEGEGAPAVDPVEVALADALSRAAAAGQWSTVEALSRELGDRRRSREASNVVRLDARAKGRRG